MPSQAVLLVAGLLFLPLYARGQEITLPITESEDVMIAVIRMTSRQPPGLAVLDRHNDAVSPLQHGLRLPPPKRIPYIMVTG